MNRFILALLFTLSTIAAISQKPHYGRFHLAVEPFLFQCKEPLINGTTHNNLGYGFNADWQRVSPENYQEAGVELDWVRPKSTLEPAAVSAYVGLNLHYVLLFPVVENKGWIFYAGGNLQGDFHPVYYPLWDDSHMYWASFSGLGAQCLARKQMNERKVFFAGFSLPLLGFISRPPTYRENKMEDTSFGNVVKLNFQDPEIAYVVNFFNPDLKAGFELFISEKFSLAFCLHFEYLSAITSYSEKYREMRKGLCIDFIF